MSPAKLFTCDITIMMTPHTTMIMATQLLGLSFLNIRLLGTSKST